MQPKSLILSLALALASQVAVAAQFEGVARYKPLGKAAEQGQDMVFSIKGDKFRMDMSNEDHQGAMIMDAKTKKAIVLIPDQKSYMVMKMEGKGRAKAKKAGKLVKTGKTETIAGHKAEEWSYEGGEVKMSLWGNKELGGWAFNNGGQDQDALEVPDEFRKGGLFPLRIVSKEGGMEATKVEKKSMAASLFEIPKGYKKMEMGSMGGGRPGAGPDPMAGMSAADKKAMMEQMKNMSPEERVMMEKMMKGK